MTKEELQKEAYEWTEKNISVGISMYNPSIEMYCSKAYKDGAEPREKQIEIDAKQIIALQKQNGELTDRLTKAKEYIKLLLMNCVGVYESTGKTIAEIQAEAEQFLNEVEK